MCFSFSCVYKKQRRQYKYKKQRRQYKYKKQRRQYKFTHPKIHPKMGALCVSITVGVIVGVVIWVWRMMNKFWFRPKKLERLLREQGLQGNPYRPPFGDVKDISKITEEAESKPMPLSDNIMHRIMPYHLQILEKYGKNSFIWFGPTPRVTLTDPVLIRDVLKKINDFQKPNVKPLNKFLISGLAVHEGQKWSNHIRIMDPAFYSPNIKIMLPLFFISCNDLISKWEGMLYSAGSLEMDVYPFLQNLANDAVSRTFGSSYKEGKRIIELQKELVVLARKAFMKSHIPGWRFLPTPTQRRMKEINKDIKSSLKDIINKREQTMKEGEAKQNDFLGILLELNHKEIKEQGIGMSIDDLIDECKLFYFTGQEPTSVLLVWTMIILSRYPDWQARAREEVLQVFGHRKPDIDGLNELKIVTMILHEVLRLYPPVATLVRSVARDLKIGNIALPAGVQVTLPVGLAHRDCEYWGDDAKEFNPWRFSKATKGIFSFFSFGWGPKTCIGQFLAIVEAKMAMSMILQKFSFELSPTYAHAPVVRITIQPKHGAHLILRNVEI